MKRLTSAQMVAHPFLSKEIAEAKHHELGVKKVHSMGEKVNFKLERENSSQSPLKTVSDKKNKFDKDEEFDELLKDFKNYQVGSKKEGSGKVEDEDEWL